MSTQQQSKEPNPYEYIDYFTETKQFRVSIPRANYRPLFSTLEEACEARDKMLASPHFPKAQPRKEYATYTSYVDPNIPEESRTA